LRSGLAGGVAGEVALIVASVSYAAAGVYARWKVRDVSPQASALLEIGFAFVVSLVLAFAIESPLATRVEASAVLAVVWLGLVGSGLAFMAFFWLPMGCHPHVDGRIPHSRGRHPARRPGET